jgi:hypothetical protein
VTHDNDSNESGHFIRKRKSQMRLAEGCPSRKPHLALIYLHLERSSTILLDRPAHPFFDGLLHIYGPRSRSLLAHPEPDPCASSQSYAPST